MDSSALPGPEKSLPERAILLLIGHTDLPASQRLLPAAQTVLLPDQTALLRSPLCIPQPCYAFPGAQTGLCPPPRLLPADAMPLLPRNRLIGSGSGPRRD